MSKNTWIILGVLVVLLIGGGVAWTMMGSGGNALSADAAGSSLAPDKVQPDDHTMGDPKAPVVLVEYFAQACSVCGHFNQEVFPQIKAKYIDTGKVRYVMRLFPLFPVDGPAYKLDTCVPPDQFFSAVDLLFRNQPQWDTAEYQGVDSNAIGLHKDGAHSGHDRRAGRCLHERHQI